MSSMQVIGHGVDIVSIARIDAMLEEHGERFVRRCFTEAERRYADAATRRRGERYAARFACKEAVLKALGTGLRSGLSWTDIEVVNQPSGRPELRIQGRCAELAAGMGIRLWHVSLSHAGSRDGYAIASVIACGEGGPPRDDGLA
jgi:holo-[acyl-carrier protein] synthase